MDFPAHPQDAGTVSVSRIRYPAGRYPHPPSRLFQLRVVRSGSSYARIDLGAGMRQVFTRPGDILVTLGEKPSFFDIEEGRDLTFVQADSGLLAQVLERLGATPADLAPLADRPFRDALIADLCARLEELPVEQPVIRVWAFGVLIALALDAARRRRAKGDGHRLTPRRLAAVTRAIDARLDRAITVAELGNLVGIRERAFSEAFRAATGLPVYQFVLRRRAERAADLLRSTGLAIAEVAQRAGFSHQAHMTRVLRQLKGVTPAQIRAAQANDDRRRRGVRS